MTSLLLLFLLSSADARVQTAKKPGPKFQDQTAVAPAQPLSLRNSEVHCIGRDENGSIVTAKFHLRNDVGSYTAFQLAIGTPSRGWVSFDTARERVPVTLENSKLKINHQSVTLDIDIAGAKQIQCAESKIVRDGKSYDVACVIAQQTPPSALQPPPPEETAPVEDSGTR